MAITRIKVHYVWVYAVMGALTPYLPLYLRQIGFSDVEVGWVNSEFGFAVLAAPPLFTLLADRFLTNRLLLLVGYSIAVAALLWLSQAETFLVAMCAFGLFTFGFASMGPLLDGLSFDTLHRQELNGQKPTEYHRIRLWGTVGFMIPAVGLYFWLTGAGPGAWWAMVFAIGAAVIGAASTGLLPGRQAPARGPALPTAEAWRTLRRWPVAVLISGLFLLWIAAGTYYAFYPLYLGSLGVADRYVGLVVNLGVFIELGFMLIAGRLVRRIGVRGVLIMGCGAMAARLMLLAAVPTIATAVLTQLFHGPFAIAVYMVVMAYVNHHAEPSFRNSMQGLYAMLCLGIARIIGSVEGGYVTEAATAATGDRLAGLRVAFAAGGALAIAATLWIGFGFRDRAGIEILQGRSDR